MCYRSSDVRKRDLDFIPLTTHNKISDPSSRLNWTPSSQKKEVLEIANTEDIENIIIRIRLCLLRRVLRLSDDRAIKTLLYGEIEEVSCRRF